MITGAIKNKVDKIWTDIWAGGIANPLTVIEQLTYAFRPADPKDRQAGSRCSNGSVLPVYQRSVAESEANCIPA